MKKLTALLLALAMVLGMVACGEKAPVETDAPTNAPEQTEAPDTNGIAPDTYTYNTYTSALGTNWNPHTWENSADSSILGYIETPLADMTVDNSEEGSYQWIFLAATDIQDVTAEHQDDLIKYNCAETDATEDYVFEISLREDMKWEDGTPINADTYIYSMQQMLDPVLSNYRANNYYSGESAIAGAEGYYYSGKTATKDNGVTAKYAAIEDLVKGEDGNYYTAEGSLVNVAVAYSLDWLGGYDLATYVGAYGDAYFDVAAFTSLSALADENGLAPLNDETLGYLQAVISVPAWGEGAEYFVNYIVYDETYPEASWDTVGLYKVDDYTIRYVCQVAYDYYYFLTSCTSNWIVYEDLYEACKEYNEDGSYKGSKYGTSLDTTISYGPYKMTVLEDAKQLVFEQNENYFEYTVDDNGNLYSTTEKAGFTVDGEYQPQYLTQKVVIDVMENDAAKLAFLAGELDDWSPEADDVINYSTSEQLYKVDETYTMRLFFHTNLDSLKAMDAEGNTNSVVMSNETFRKAMSLALDRTEFVSATAGYKPAYSMLSSLYFYNVYEDPASIYRNTDQAMQAICNLYGVEYGENTPYADLESAYKSINGYNKTEATALFAQACDELVAAGLYTEGENIVIQVGWKAGAMSAADQQQVTLLNKYLNDAMAGTGFGTIELVAIDNLTARYEDVANGVYAIGWGAWGGAAFYPFSMFQVYCDDEYVTYIHEKGCWDPATEQLTLTVNGEEVTLTWKEWSRSMSGTGAYASADFDTKLQILADLEENLLEKYYFIPVCTTTACSMMSYKTNNYTENYSIMYGFGGLRLTTYNYTNAEWDAFVAEAGGELGY